MIKVTRSTTLAETGLEIFALFKKIKRIDQHVHGEEWSSALFAAEADRFDLWAVNLGLFVSGHGSLDYRIREAESLERTIHRFMKDLNESLKEVLEYCTGESQQLEKDDMKDAPARSFDDLLGESLEEESDQELESDLGLLVDSVRDPIDRLYKLSTRIRNPSSRLGSSKALQLQQVDPDSGVDLLQAFEAFDYDFASSLFLQYRKSKALDECQTLEPIGEEIQKDTDNHVWEPIRSILSQYQDHISAGIESFLVRRLARANVRRRQQFAYWRRHRDKLSQHTQTFTQNAEAGEDLNSFLVNPKVQNNDLKMPIGPVAHSVTTASRLNISQLVDRDDRSTVSVSEYAPSAWRPGKEIIDFPPPPKRDPNEKFFECQYCFTLCSTDLLTERAWKAHLIHDLRPYICTYEHCKNADQLYDSRQDWMQHENSSHRRVWRCPEHPARNFAHIQKYREHLQSEHPEYNEQMTVDQLIYSGETSLGTSDRCCPICEMNLEDARSLHTHLALHLERFALFSLPRSIGDIDSDSVEGNSDQANIAFEGSRDEEFNSGLGSIFERSTIHSTSSSNLASFAAKDLSSVAPESDGLSPGVPLGEYRPTSTTITGTKNVAFGMFSQTGQLNIKTMIQNPPDGEISMVHINLADIDYFDYLQGLSPQEIEEYCRLKWREHSQGNRESGHKKETTNLEAVKLAKAAAASRKLENDVSAEKDELRGQKVDLVRESKDGMVDMDETPQNAEGYFGKDNEWNKGNPPYSFLKARDKSIRLENYIDPIQKIAATVAKTLKSEMLAPNVQLLVEILPLLNHEEVLDLRVRYKKIVKISDGRGVNVAKHIKLRLKDENPNLMKACYACALGKWESEAYWANFLYQNEKSRRELLIEALMGRTNHEIREIKDGFKDKKYNDSLKTCMRVELKEDRLKKAVLLVLEERRMEDDAVLDQVLVKLDVEQLHLAVDRERPDENSMINIILLRSDTHLREVLRLYQREYQANFAREMLKKSENLVGEVLAHVLNGVINRPVRDALLINHALTALRKDEPCSELIISRLLRYHWDPKHMIDIKRAFRERFGKDLREVVRESIEGEWGQFCERLCAMPVGYRILGLEPIA